MNSEKTPARSRRTNNWWEVIYDPNANEKMGHDWNFENDKGPTDRLFDLGAVKDAICDGITFTDCDFSGTLDRQRYAFKNCTFIGCDFGLATFLDVKFSSCTFRETTFSQSRIVNCKFEGCNFQVIGLGDTDLEGTYVSNPCDFIWGAATNLKNLPNKISPRYQRRRFEETKSGVARQLLASNSKEGPEYAFYEAVRACSIQECRARRGKALIDLTKTDHIDARTRIRTQVGVQKRFSAFLSIVFSSIDEFLIRCVGYVNGWGSSISRVAVVGLILSLTFAVYYKLCEADSLSTAFIKSTELFLLFGYTKHAALFQAGTLQEIVFLGNALAGLFWYMIFVPTLVNRLTRIRG